MSANAYVDQRFNLRPPVLAVCFMLGVFSGFYLNALRADSQTEETPDGFSRTQPPPEPSGENANNDTLDEYFHGESIPGPIRPKAVDIHDPAMPGGIVPAPPRPER